VVVDLNKPLKLLWLTWMKEMQFYTLVLCLLVHDILNLNATLPYVMHNQPLYAYAEIFVNYITCSD